jgi:hypothetical protein
METSHVESTKQWITQDPREWSLEARLSSQVWFGMDSATRFVVQDRWGYEALLDLEFKFIRTHQEAHFLDGVRKLGLAGWPHPQLCAAYHCLSNLIGGLDMGYQDDGDRAWVFYMPPHCYAGTPTLPTPMLTSLKPEIMYANLRAWHANNGVLLGNDRLRFVLTDLMFAGGPYDAGYWEEAPHALASEERFLINLDKERGRPGPPPPLGPADWPQARREAALRKYNAEYAVGGLGEIAQIRDMEEAVTIGEISHRATFVNWARALVGQFGLAHETDSVVKCSELFRRSFEVLGDTFESVPDGRDRILLHRTSRLSLPQYANWATLPLAMEEAFARAWSVVSRTIGDEVHVSVEASRSNGADATVWRFRP